MCWRHVHAEESQFDLSSVMVPSQGEIDTPLYHRGKEVRLMTQHDRGGNGIAHRQRPVEVGVATPGVINPRDIQGCPPFNDSLRASLRSTSTPAACKASVTRWAPTQ